MLETTTFVSKFKKEVTRNCASWKKKGGRLKRLLSRQNRNIEIASNNSKT